MTTMRFSGDLLSSCFDVVVVANARKNAQRRRLICAIVSRRVLAGVGWRALLSGKCVISYRLPTTDQSARAIGNHGFVEFAARSNETAKRSVETFKRKCTLLRCHADGILSRPCRPQV